MTMANTSPDHWLSITGKRAVLSVGILVAMACIAVPVAMSRDDPHRSCVARQTELLLRGAYANFPDRADYAAEALCLRHSGRVVRHR